MNHIFGHNVAVHVPFGIFETKWDAFSFWYKHVHGIDLNKPEYTGLIPVIDVNAAIDLYNIRSAKLVLNSPGYMFKYDPHGWLYSECRTIQRVVCPVCEAMALNVCYTCVTPDKQETNVCIPVCRLYIEPTWAQASDAVQAFCDENAYGIKTYAEGSTYRVTRYDGQKCKLDGFMGVVEQYMDPAFTIMPEGSFHQCLEKFACANCHKEWYSPSDLAVDIIEKKQKNEQDANN